MNTAHIGGAPLDTEGNRTNAARRTRLVPGRHPGWLWPFAILLGSPIGGYIAKNCRQRPVGLCGFDSLEMLRDVGPAALGAGAISAKISE